MPAASEAPAKAEGTIKVRTGHGAIDVLLRPGLNIDSFNSPTPPVTSASEREDS
ncbi:hypothetical protein ACIODT_08260 [Streptomyces sp. NPDC088251]|uniref:hypothetical protein n=1 Tax=unclassified Streptomyces TaxID=2593676 RepID=UPI0037F4E971